jgi:Flp pilus assembly pilin Flp
MSELSKNNRQLHQKGQSLVEYLVIVALVAVGGIGVMRVVGQSINVSFARVAKALGANASGKIENAEVRETNYSKKSLRNFMTGSENERDHNED